MSYALIESGGPDGRYTIRLDWGEELKAALLATLSTAIAQLDVKIAQTEANLAVAEAAEAAQVAYLNTVIDSLVAVIGDEAGTKVYTAIYTQGLKDLRLMQGAHAPIRIALRKLNDAKNAAVKRTAYWNDFNPVETREAWCADLTEDAEGYVATLEVPGESSLILVQPGAGGPNLATDGLLSARELMSPEQAYFNAAILPGWQKFLPTYRWGTLTSIDFDSNIGSVSLAPAISSAQSLPVNQADTLENVPIEYMQCNAKVFKIDDRVIVRFNQQDWGSPTIVGFVDTPRGCPPYFYPNKISNQGFSNGKPVNFPTKDFWLYGWKPLSYSVISGSLPPGLAIDAITGEISGTSSTEGAYPGIVLRCTDKAEKYDDSNEFSILITAAYNTPLSFALATGSLERYESTAQASVKVQMRSDLTGLTYGTQGYFIETDAVVETYGGGGSFVTTHSFERQWWFEGPVSSTPDPVLWSRITVTPLTQGVAGSFSSSWVTTLTSGYEWDIFNPSVGVPSADAFTATWLVEISNDGGSTIVAQASGSIALSRLYLYGS